MPTRLLRDGILTSEAVCGLGFEAEVFYRRLMSVADDYGLFSANLSILRSALYPLQIDAIKAKDVEKWMLACESAGLILRYEVAGKQFLQVLKFNQQLRTKPKFPEPSQGSMITVANRLQSVVHSGVSVCEGVDVLAADEPHRAQRSQNTLVQIPEELETAEFREEWDHFKEHRKKKRSPMTAHAESLMLAKLAERPLQAIATLQECQERGWSSFKWEWIDRSAQQNGNGHHAPAPRMAWPKVPGEFVNRERQRLGKPPAMTWGEILPAEQFELEQLWTTR